MLTSAGHDARTYQLTGPTAFTLSDAAELMSRVTGRPVFFHDENDEEAFASRSGSGAADWEIRGWVGSYWAIRDGSFAAVSSDLDQLTGQPPTSLERHLDAGSGSVGTGDGSRCA